MKAAAWVMSDRRRFVAVEKGLAVGRLVAGKDQKIKRLPFPGSAWTRSKDMPAPPKQTFRQWWDRTHSDPPGGHA